MNFFIIHGGHGGTDVSRGKWLKEKLTPYGEVITPSFPLAEKANPQSRKCILDKYKTNITPNSLFICHSIWCLFSIRYLTANTLPIKAICFVAAPGGKTVKGRKKELESLQNPFLPSTATKKKFQQLVPKRFAIYSDDDHVLTLRSLKSFAKSIHAQELFIPNKGHFWKKAQIQEIPELREIITTLI